MFTSTTVENTKIKYEISNRKQVDILYCTLITHVKHNNIYS